jgi:hypothetical protein
MVGRYKKRVFLEESQKYARYVPKIPQGRTHSYYPCHFNRYFPCQNVDRTQIALIVLSKSGNPGPVPKTLAQIRYFLIATLLMH